MSAEQAAVGSTMSLLRSFIGSHLRRIGGWIAIADLLHLMDQAGSSGASTRSAVSRLKTKGVLESVRHGARSGYALSDAARLTLARGDRRIYSYRPMLDDDPWMLLLYTIPEDARGLRSRLRGQLTWLGCGRVTPGTWIGPGHLLGEADEVLGEHGLRGYVTMFRTGTPDTPVPLAEAVAQWWDLDDLAARYRRFIAGLDPVAASWRGRSGTARQAFADHLLLIDAWRDIPYLDPALPERLLPGDWPGATGLRLFTELNERLAPLAARHADETVAR